MIPMLMFSYELPAFDGSSDRYCQMITEAGIEDQSEIRYSKIQTCFIEQNEAISTLTPSSALHISTKIDFMILLSGLHNIFMFMMMIIL